MDPRTDEYRGSRPSASVASSSPAPPKQQHPQPPLFSTAAPPPALPVPPSLPAVFTAPNVAPKPRAQEEMKVMWDKVLPLMADCVEARKAHQDSQKDFVDFERMLTTPRYTALLTDADKERAAQRLAGLKATRDDKGRGVTTALNALKDTQWWPVGSNQDEGAAEKYRDLIQYAAQLNTTASEMFQTYVTKTLDAAKSVAPPETATDVPSHDSSSRPLKRRRVSNAADDAPALDPADVAELEQMQERLTTLDARVANLHNDLVSMADQNTEDIAAQIDAKLESLSILPNDHPSAPSSLELQRVELSVTKTNEDVNDLGQEVALLISDFENIRTQSDILEKERQKQREELAAMQLQFNALEESSKKDSDTIHALGQALESLTRARPPSPPSLPLEFVLQVIDEPVRDVVQSVVRPMVDDLAKDLKAKIAKQDADTYGQLWGKIALTLKVVEAVSKVTPTTETSVPGT
ncbi:hypothetical protein C8R47DRAFT_1115165 [Mycena vitilis]|nr:hypothetical protein C8R47DRAFT_1115165 [Mycena vitilis]